MSAAHAEVYLQFDVAIPEICTNEATLQAQMVQKLMPRRANGVRGIAV